MSSAARLSIFTQSLRPWSKAPRNCAGLIGRSSSVWTASCYERWPSSTPSGTLKRSGRQSIAVGRHSYSGRAALEHRTIHNPDIFADPEHSYGAKAIEPVRTVLAVPILKGDDFVGVIILAHRKSGPSQTSRSLWSRHLPTKPPSPSIMRDY